MGRDAGATVGVVPYGLKWYAVAGAVEVTTGARCFPALPYKNAESLQRFVKAFAEAFPDGLNLPLLDNRGALTGGQPYIIRYRESRVSNGF